MIYLNKKYSALISSVARYFLITGGRGSSKSFSINTYLCLLMLEEKRSILFLRKTLTSAHLSIIPEFVEKLDLMGFRDLFHITKTEIICNSNGSVIYFRGIQSSSSDNTANLKSLNNISVLVIDEAEELTDESVFDRIDLSVRQKGVENKVIIALNPTTKNHWVYQRFFEKAGVQPGFTGTKGNVTYIHTDYRDNIENLSPSFLEQIENIKENNPKKYDHQILGGWLDKAEGVIYSNWKLGKFEEVSVPVYGQDFGFSVDPTTLLKVCIDKAQKKIFVKECFYRPKLTTSEIAALNKHHAGQSLIYADSAEPRLIDELKSYELNIKGTEKGPGSITAGIAAIQDYEMIIDPDSTNIIKELNNYAWSDKKSGTPIDAWNHCFIGSTLITTDKGLVPLKEIKEGDFVLTSKGFKRVLKKFNNGLKQVNRYTMQSDTFSVSLCSTKEHKIKSTTWEKISELQSGMMVYQHKNSMEKLLDCTQESVIFQGGKKECTLRFGNRLTVKCQKGFMYIIKTVIHGITQLIISNVLRVKNTSQVMEKKGLKIIRNLLNIFNQKGLRKLKNGINLKKEDCGILNTEKEHGIIENTKNTNANNAEVSLNHDTQELLSFAITTAKLKHFDIGESWIEEVYDIMVEDCHEYFANGILVHNCLDALRYAVYPTLKPQREGFFF